jgi:hypothetical protein
MTVLKRKIIPNCSKKNGLFVLNFSDIKNLPFKVKERSLVYLPKAELGGNHKHSRWEAFIGLSDDLQIIWQDKNKKTYKQNMTSKSSLLLFIVYPNTPHVILNNSSKKAVLLELASDKQKNVEIVNLLK